MQISNYKVIEESDPKRLQKTLNDLSIDGWRPILMSTVAARSGTLTTVVLEHVPESEA